MKEVSLIAWPPTDGIPDATRVSDKMAARGYTVTRYTYPAGADFPPHSHPWDKCSSVLEGRFEVIVGDTSYVLARGDLLFIPAGVVHAARVLGDVAVTSLDGVKR
jgi:quercetin dioxygenase-like cupin family protein